MLTASPAEAPDGRTGNRPPRIGVMQSLFHPQPIPYTGRELRSHWIFDTFGILGDAAVAFVGPCDVATAGLVDRVDAAAGEAIRAAWMLHVMVERFDPDLPRAILHQRLLVALAAERLRELAPGVPLCRSGDDLLVGERKLSVSIATVSAVSALVHLGLNVDPTGAPVPAIGLAELGVDPQALGEALLAAYTTELAGMDVARVKVRAVP